ISDKNDTLGELKKAYREYIDRYAKWARVLSAFPPGRIHLYTDQIKKLRDSLRNISIVKYIKEFHTILEYLSAVVEKATAQNDKDIFEWVKTMETALGECYVASRRLFGHTDKLSRRVIAIFNSIDFKKLYDEGKALFSIGLDIRQNKLSDTHYDLLASEARQTGFIAIAKGDVPGKHWFRLARPLTVAGENRVLLSWGGTMFEYLMPLIIMRSYDNTLLDETYKAVVTMQYDYGEQRRVPWGISESGYYAFDLHMNYQYKAFGVPGLGMKSGLVRETVISPYSACLALTINAKAVLSNMYRLEKIGALGRYGFYEAIDYTQSRMQKGKKKRIVKSYMSHHQGMILASILNCLQDEKMQELFHSATCVKATEMLLKEKVPPRNITLSFGDEQPDQQEFAEEIHAVRTFKHFLYYPEAHFLSNGSYTVMITQYGTGYSMCRDIMIHRWYSDCLRRAPGIHVYIRDADSGAVWSATFLPTCVRADQERAVFDQHKVTFHRQIGSIETTLDICISPECDMEVRSLDITNNGEKPVSLNVYCAYTPALCSRRDFEAHPAFAELFVQTETDPQHNTIYARHRGKNICNAMKVCTDGSVELLTDRANIFGRQNIFGIPSCMDQQRGERDVTRAVAIKCGIDLPEKASRNISFVIAASDNMQDVVECLSGITGEEDIRRVFHLAWTHSQVEMRYLKLKDMQANLFQRIASRTVINIPSVHTYTGEPDGMETLWKMGLSGDLPIICLFAHDIENIDTVKTVAKAQEFMSHRCVKADLVIIYDGGAEYLCPVRDRIKELEQAALDRPYNRIYAFSRMHLSDMDIATIVSASCLVLEDNMPLHEQLKVNLLTRSHALFERDTNKVMPKMPKRLKAFDNGSGGFINHATEYCVDIADKAPLPWSNILVNKEFGSLVSAGGGGYTWAGNAQMTRLTPFRNDSLTDIAGEGVFVRNDRTGTVFSIMPDVYASGRYRVTHGFGYTLFEQFGQIGTNVAFFVDLDMPVKAGILSIENNTGRDETFSVYYFAEPGIVTPCNSLTARFKGDVFEAASSFSDPEKAIFMAVPGQDLRYTASSYEFFGSPGNNILPEALKTKELSNSDGEGATLLALQTTIRLGAGERKELALLLGYGDQQQIDGIIAAMDTPEKLKERYQQTKAYWLSLVEGIKVSTQSKSFDTLVNGWLIYQTYASRIWGRTGYYQSGGAYGFRDQLQDVMALIYTDPGIAREHIIKFAERQFIEGDVLHWWHEPTSGVRTKIKDDKLFLPYVTCEYERITGDMSVFDQSIKYLDGKPIPEGQYDIYEEFTVGDTKESLFMHCVRAIDSALVFGEKGLPLMGSGDWNDGMDKIGEHGKGESVWLAFFLVEVLRMFAALCRAKGEHSIAQRYEAQRETLKNNIEKNAWGGEWYLRAFFDDGTPVGSKACPECKIDLVSQAWAVISGAVRARRAFLAAEENLVMREEGVIRLLTPAFDKWDKDPGYIKSYLPGLRENGGQYSHAAAWFVIAATKLREKNTAMALFQMLNPINHTRTPAAVAKYKGEPYVMAADVYYSEEHKGRAGWTWYTGSSGWMYQAAIIHLLGMRIDRDVLSIYPCVPDDFGQYSIEYNKDGTLYIITVDIKPGYKGTAWLSIDGQDKQKGIKLDKQGGVYQIYACW
ncbi:MAG: GH36-type glycosyl hydrolase domain-containing protein, partial [Christensenellales bacterium]